MTDQSFALLSVRMFAVGTKVRTGIFPDDYTCVEDLSAGDAIYDPIGRRFHDINDMNCTTLDRDRARSCGLDLYRLGALAGAQDPVLCLIESRNLGPDRRHTPPSAETGSAVFYGFSFGARVVLDTGSGLCEMR